ncbi:flagellar hook-basal body complex protein FliE [Psychrosphaera sp. F3M07]|jgi:flagellar hook-basal body complex protein FliE|uniref:Flagellar hook-basal body complex protein FliE n=1 Tax=Psychrosphaera aquimarina TaxID=2044854 RepID=A0ABU3QZJ7_9GAMM|nr:MULTISPECIES: flagellar hook-basal body complex protein FliE [Psychrosphaera]MBU2917506.1 flagellar hook-basal body complex protein FliE [Psychrosphaera sp. F3M07]MDU0112848.1 flagellar hook-basal body complex protein FliE [Psychrosphaera aquimarina]
MNIQANNLYSELQAMANQVSGSAPAIRPNMEVNPQQVNNTSSSNFGQLLEQAINNVNDIQAKSGELKTALEMGDRSVTLAETVIASNKAGIAFEATVQVRNKLVEAYKQIMSMPV